MDSVLIVAVVILAGISLAGLVFARRAWRLSTSVERQLMDSRAQQAEHHRENLEVARVTGERLEAQTGRSRDETNARLDGATERIDQLGAQVAGLSNRLNEVSGTVSEVHSKMTGDLAERVGTIADAVEIVLRKPLYRFPVDAGNLEKNTENEVVQLAQSLAILRPLVPYPKWRFDADWANPDLSFLLRQRIWQYFSDRRLEADVIVPWHYGTRLRIYLGNDVSRQVYIAGCIDPNEFAFLDRFLQPGMTFLDAGANEGVYTVFAAKRLGPAGAVWSFEPSQREVARLGGNLELNGITARIFPLALADQKGSAEMNVAGYGHEGHNTLGEFVHDIEGSRKESISLARLDDVIGENPLPRLDVIKIDVEGAELKMLQGAQETLRRYRPVLLFEASDNSLRKQGASLEALLDFLRSEKYQLYLFDPYSGLPAPASHGVSSDNMLAVPAGVTLPDAVYRPWPIHGAPLDRPS